MPSQGPNSPSSVAQSGSGSTWGDLNNVKISNNADASTAVGTQEVSKDLEATAFSFAIFSGSEIVGIVPEIERSAGAIGGD